MSSSRLPCDSVSRCSRSLSSFCSAFLLALTSLSSVLRLSSSDFCSCEMTFPSSCCSRPPCVTVKSMTVVLALSYGEKLGLGSLQVMNILKFLSKSISPPAILIVPLLFFQTICFSSTGSRMGSTSFSIPSIISVFPFYRQNFRNQSLNLGWARVQIDRPFSISSVYLRMIHDWPWPWGSMRSGYLSDLVTMMPFWTERESLGRPWRFHSPTVASSTRKEVSS